MVLWESDEEFIEMSEKYQLVKLCRSYKAARFELECAAKATRCDDTTVAIIQGLIGKNPELNDREIIQLYVDRHNQIKIREEQERSKITATQMLQDRIEYEKELTRKKYHKNVARKMLMKHNDIEEIAYILDEPVEFVKEVEKEMAVEA